jgi:hypothetical protein
VPADFDVGLVPRAVQKVDSLAISRIR